MSTQKEQTLIAKQLAGEEPIPTSQLGAVVRFIRLSDEEVEKAISNGDASFAATMLSTNVDSLVARRNRALGRSTEPTQVVPAITRLAKLSDEDYQNSSTRVRSTSSRASGACHQASSVAAAPLSAFASGLSKSQPRPRHRRHPS